MWYANALERIFRSTFNKDIGLQFWISLLSSSFFSISFITTCFWELLSSPLSNADSKLDIREF